MNKKTPKTTQKIDLPPDCASNPSILKLNEQIKEALAKQVERIELNGSRVLRLGSVAIGTLAVLAREAKSQGCELIFYKFSNPARRPFEICRVEQHFCWED